MCSLRVLLGTDPLLETEPAALPALRSLCQTLSVRTRVDEEAQAIFLESPLVDQGLAILSTSDGSPEWQAVAERVSVSLSERLTGVGARAPIVKSAADLKGNSLILRVDLGNLPAQGVIVSYGWRHWRQGRGLATLIAEGVEQESGLPNLGTRVSISSNQWAGLPVIAVMIGLSDASLIHLSESAPLFESVSAGIYQGLARHWVDPLIRQVREAVQPFGLRQAPEESVAPPPEDLITAPETIPAAISLPVSAPVDHPTEEEAMKTMNDSDSRIEEPTPLESEWMARLASVPILSPNRTPPPLDLAPVPNLTPAAELDLRPAPLPVATQVHDPEPLPVRAPVPDIMQVLQVEASDTAIDQTPPDPILETPETTTPEPMRRPVRQHLLGPCQVPGNSNHVYLFRRHEQAPAPAPSTTFTPSSAPEAPHTKKPAPVQPQPRIIQSSDSVIRFP